MTAPALIETIASMADVRFDGQRPYDLDVHDRGLFSDLLQRGGLALGEGYVRGDWDCDDLPELIARLLRARYQLEANPLQGLREAWQRLREWMLNPQTLHRSFRVGRVHYDIDPRVYAAMLDARRIYSCAIWNDGDTLDQAQERKLDLICRKLELQPGHRLLDVGCGWGGLLAYACEHYGVQGYGITISARQYAYIRDHHTHWPIEVLMADYRSLPQLNQPRFDRIVSVGMFEHVGPVNQGTYHRILRDCLLPDGLFLLQTIGHFVTTAQTDPWIERYIFPGGRLPAPSQLAQGVEGVFQLQSWENYGLHYERTLLAWWEKFSAHWPLLQGALSDEFYRMWRYYLLGCAGYFRSGHGQLWQLLLRPAL